MNLWDEINHKNLIKYFETPQFVLRAKIYLIITILVTWFVTLHIDFWENMDSLVQKIASIVAIFIFGFFLYSDITFIQNYSKGLNDVIEELSNRGWRNPETGYNLKERNLYWKLFFDLEKKKNEYGKLLWWIDLK